MGLMFNKTNKKIDKVDGGLEELATDIVEGQVDIIDEVEGKVGVVQEIRKTSRRRSITPVQNTRTRLSHSRRRLRR
jgi:hypothetical protein